MDVKEAAVEYLLINDQPLPRFTGEWSPKRLGGFGTTYGGLTGKTSRDFEHGATRYVPFMNVISNVAINTNDLALVDVVKGETQNRIECGDLLFNCSSETPEEVGLCSAVLVQLDNVCLNSFCFGFRPKNHSTIDPKYLAYYFRSAPGRELLAPLAQGATRYNLSKKAFLQLDVPLPPTKAEQRAIAEALSDADALIAALQRLIVKKRAIKQGTMQALLTGRQRLPGFTGGWKNKSFDEALVRINLKANQIQASEYESTGLYPVVDQGIDPVIGFSDRSEKAFHCPEEGVIIFGDHTCIVKFIDFDFLVGADGTQAIRAKSGQNTRFLALQLEYDGVEPTGYNRHFKFLRNRVFTVPEYAEQTTIATVLADMDAEIEALEARLSKTRALKAGMMQQLLTGRIRLPLAEAA